MFAKLKTVFCFPETNVALETYVYQFSHHETMLTRFQCCSLKIFPSNGKQTTIPDDEVEVEEKGRNERNLEGRGGLLIAF